MEPGQDLGSTLFRSKTGGGASLRRGRPHLLAGRTIRINSGQPRQPLGSAPPNTIQMGAGKPSVREMERWGGESRLAPRARVMNAAPRDRMGGHCLSLPLPSASPPFQPALALASLSKLACARLGFATDAFLAEAPLLLPEPRPMAFLGRALGRCVLHTAKVQEEEICARKGRAR